MKKKVISMLLCSVLCLSLVAGCGGGSDESVSGEGGGAETSENGDSGSEDISSGDTESGEIEEITMMIPSMGEEPVDLQVVVDAMNEILEPEINVHLNLLVSTGTNYSQQVTMKMSSGEPVDLICASGVDINTAISQNQLMPLDDILQTYGADMMESIPDVYTRACKYEGTQYFVPVVRGCAAQPIILVREDMAQEAGYGMEELSKIKTYEDFEQLLAAVQQVKPDVALFSPLAAGGSAAMVSSVDGLFTTDGVDGLSDCMGVLIGDNTEVVNYWESDLFAKECEVMKEWYDKGYIWKEALTSATTAIDTYLFSGTLFSFAFTSNTNETEAWRQAESWLFAQAPTINIPLGPAYVRTLDILNFSVAVPSTSKHAEAAVRFLNYFYGSPELTELLYYGIEGVHYNVDENNLVVKTDEGNANYNNTFHMYIGDQRNARDKVDDGAGYFKQGIDLTEEAVISPVLGYYPAMGEYSLETTSVSNVCSEYEGGLLIGSSDPAVVLPEFLSELKEAGIDTLIEAKQAQIDEFMGSN